MNTLTFKLLFRLSIWFILEVLLTLLNLDRLADYSEFLNLSQTTLKSTSSELIQSG